MSRSTLRLADPIKWRGECGRSHGGPWRALGSFVSSTIPLTEEERLGSDKSGTKRHEPFGIEWHSGRSDGGAWRSFPPVPAARCSRCKGPLSMSAPRGQRPVTRSLGKRIVTACLRALYRDRARVHDPIRRPYAAFAASAAETSSWLERDRTGREAMSRRHAPAASRPLPIGRPPSPGRSGGGLPEAD